MAEDFNRKPPMDPGSSEATGQQLARAAVQGKAYRDALAYMTTEVAHDGGSQTVGDYLAGYAIEDAEGMYHYARNWALPEDGDYTLRVHVDSPTFMRHDEINGRRFTEPADAMFIGVKVKRGAEPVTPPTD